MNKNLIALFFFFLFQLSFSQIIEITHQSNGTVLQMPIETIDSVNVVNQNNNYLKTIYQNNGNILGISVQDVDSVTFIVPDINFLPTLSTLEASNSTPSEFISGGNISNDGGSPIINRGVCWNINPNPTIANSHTSDGTGIGNFSSVITPVSPSTVYFIRAYATNENGTNYGNEIIFTTPEPNTSLDPPIVITEFVNYNDGLLAEGFGYVDSASNISSKGICWAIGTTPTINSEHTNEGTSLGGFSSSFEDLLPNTLYRVRAYAANNAGVSYGEEVLFRTNNYPTQFSTSLNNYLNYGYVNLQMSVNYDGESEIVERGVCWSTEQIPTLEDNVVVIGSGEGNYHKTFTNLDADDTYYYRAYATNGVGTSYGPLVTASEENIIENEDLFKILYESFGITGSRHYDFGQKGVDIFSDMISGDMALSASSYGWYDSTSNLVDTVISDSQTKQFIYDYYFKIIDIVNPLVEALTPFGSIPNEAEERWLLGHCLALRGYSYFYLSQLFQEDYDESETILPLHINGQYDDTPVEMGAIFSNIIYDLGLSEQLLNSYVRPDKLHIDKTVVQGLMAYTYAAMGDYQNAKIKADEVINAGYPLTSTDELAFPGAGSGFNNVNTPSWIWGVDLTEEIGHQLVDWWGQIDCYTYSYAWAGDHKSMDDGLYGSMEADDIRLTQFGTGTGLLQPIGKFFDPNRAIGGQYIITTDLIFMRSDEFHLLSAECAARLGNVAAAQNTMSAFLSSRSATAAATVSGLSGQALIDYIYLQTRLELWGEGKSYLAMKRNQATVNRGSNHVFRAEETFDHDQDELTYDVNLYNEGYTPPQLEFLNCEGMTSEGSLIYGQESNFTFYIPYVTSNGTYINGNSVYDSMSIQSNGVPGLTANLEIGSFNQYEGVLEFNVTGTPEDWGTAYFSIAIGGQYCYFEFEVPLIEGCDDYVTILDINFDNAPEETYWELYSTSDSSTPLYSGGSNGSYEGLTSIMIPMCLESGDFVLSFHDISGNGMNSNGVIGNYILSDTNGNTYACGGLFTYSDLTYFTTGTNYQTNNIEVQITLDSWPEELYWQIIDEDGNVVVSPGVYAPYNNPYAGLSGIINNSFCLESGTYTFEIYDDYGDGAGPVTVTGPSGVILFSSDGSYGGYASATFTF